MPVTEPGTILRTSFVLAVHDVERSASHWCDVLGFSPRPVGDDGWRFVVRDICCVMLGECPDAVSPADLGDHSYFGYIHLDNVDRYHAEIAARGADIIAGPADKPWGMRELAVRTIDGHRVMFGQEIG